jgi:hypothetical protein
MKTRPELAGELHRLSLALTRLNLRPGERRELEGALDALAWVLDYVDRPAPTTWVLTAAALDQLDQLVLTESPDALAAAPSDAPATFIERSQPHEVA